MLLLMYSVLMIYTILVLVGTVNANLRTLLIQKNVYILAANGFKLQERLMFGVNCFKYCHPQAMNDVYRFCLGCKLGLFTSFAQLTCLQVGACIIVFLLQNGLFTVFHIANIQCVFEHWCQLYGMLLQSQSLHISWEVLSSVLLCLVVLNVACY